MTEPEPIAVVVAADANFAMQLAAVIAGLSSTTARELDLFVIHDGYDLELRERVGAAARDAVTLHWSEVDRESLARTQMAESYLPPATLFRLQMADLVPSRVERLIYLDVDVVVRAPLDELWETDLDGCAVGAVRDPVVPWAAAPHGLRWSQLGVPPDIPYFNAGVLVVDVPAWRGRGIAESALETLSRHSLRCADQCALNTVVSGDWRPLAPRWNLQAGHLVGDGSLAWITEGPDPLRDAIEDPAIVHFNTSPFGRPWIRGCTHPWQEGWFEQLDRTPWAGWRPRTPIVSGPVRQVARRVRRATNLLLHG